MGGGFLYTNQNTLSLGLVCGLHHLHDAKKTGAANAGRFQTTSGCCTADRGWQAGGIFRSRSAGSRHQHAAGVVGDGVLIAGYAAGMCMNLVLPFAEWIWRLPPGSCSKNRAFSDEKLTISVSKNWRILSASSEWPAADMRMYQKLPAFLDNPRMFSGYPGAGGGRGA